MSPSDVSWVETGRFVAHPWYCDANGHLNTRFIQGFFDDATQHLLALCSPEKRAGVLGVVDVRCAMDFNAEVTPGALVLVTSGFSTLGNTSFTSVHEMRSIDKATLFATCETVSVFFDLANRKSAKMTDEFRSKSSRLLVTTAA